MSLEREIKQIIEVLEEFESQADPLCAAIAPILERYMELIVGNPALKHVIDMQHKVQLAKAIWSVDPNQASTVVAKKVNALFNLLED